MSGQQQGATPTPPTVVASTSIADTTHLENGVEIGMSRDLWHDWAEIAVTACINAIQARDEADATEEDYKGSKSHLLTRHLRESMVAITSAAHAIDVARAQARDTASPGVVQSPGSGATKANWVFAVMDSTRQLTAQQQQQWPAELAWLFGDRNDAVHHGNAVRPAEPLNPGVYVTWEAASYTADNAKRALRLMFAVLDVLTQNNPGGPGRLALLDPAQKRAQAANLLYPDSSEPPVARQSLSEIAESLRRVHSFDPCWCVAGALTCPEVVLPWLVDL